MRGRGGMDAYWHDLAALPYHALLGTHVHDRAVQAAARLLDTSHHQKHARIPRNALNLLTRAVAPHGITATDAPRHPLIPGAGAVPNRVAQVSRGVEVARELVAARLGAPADDAPEGLAARVAPDEGLGQRQDVHAQGRGARGETREEGEGERRGGLRAGGGGAEADACLGGHGGVVRGVVVRFEDGRGGGCGC